MKSIPWRACGILIVSVLLFSCNKPRGQTEIKSVELAKIVAISNSGTALHVDSSLNCIFYLFYGNPGSGKPMYYQGKVTPAFWDTLNSKFEKIKYKTLDTTDKAWGIDGESYELIIHWKNGMKKITRFIPSQADSLISVLNWLNSSYKTIELKQRKAPFKFETTYQNPPPINYKFDSVKFPPPEKGQLK